MALWFLAITLLGFVPDSVMKVTAIAAGKRPPFPLLLQTRTGALFPLFIFGAWQARAGDAGLHKRMMFLATAVALPPAIDRITWLPSTFPVNAIGSDL